MGCAALREIPLRVAQPLILAFFFSECRGFDESRVLKLFIGHGYGGMVIWKDLKCSVVVRIRIRMKKGRL